MPTSGFRPSRRCRRRRVDPGVSRNEETLQPTVYLNKLPASFPPGSRILVTDPMIATGACAHVHRA